MQGPERAHPQIAAHLLDLARFHGDRVDGQFVALQPAYRAERGLEGLGDLGREIHPKTLGAPVERPDAEQSEQPADVIDVAVREEQALARGQRSQGNADIENGAQLGDVQRGVDPAQGHAADGVFTRFDGGQHGAPTPPEWPGFRRPRAAGR